MSIKKTITYALDSVASESTATIKIDVKQNGSVVSTKDYNMTIRPAKADKYTKWVVLAVAGQSNSVGYDESENTTLSNPNSDPDRIKQVGLFGTDNLKLIPLQSMAQNLQNMTNFGLAAGKKGTKGIHLPLAELMAKHIPSDYGIIVVPVAYGMTFLTRPSGTTRTYNTTNLKPDSDDASNDYWTVGKAYHQTLRDRVKWALDQGQGKAVNKFAGVIWCQGEADTAQFNGNSSNHGALFQALVNQLATDWADYNACSPSGTMDKSVWFVHDTTVYWRQRTANANTEGVDVSNIWKQYQQFLPMGHVVNILPLEEYTNAVNGGGTRTSSTYNSHYGNNAYRDVVAPRVLDAMLKSNMIYGQAAGARNTTTFGKVITKVSCRSQGLDVKEDGNVIWATANSNNYTISTANTCGWAAMVFDEDITEVKFSGMAVNALLVYRAELETFRYQGLLLANASNFGNNVTSYDRFWLLHSGTSKDMNYSIGWEAIVKDGYTFGQTINAPASTDVMTVTINKATNGVKVMLNDTVLIDKSNDTVVSAAKPRIGFIYGWTSAALVNNSPFVKILSATKEDGTVLKPLYEFSSDSLTFDSTASQSVTVTTTGTISNVSTSTSIISATISGKTITVTPSDSGTSSVTFDLTLENGNVEKCSIPVTVNDGVYYNYFKLVGQKAYTSAIPNGLVATGSGNKQTTFDLDTNIPVSEITIKDASSVTPYVTFDLANKYFTFISVTSDCLPVTFMWNGIELGTAYVIFSSNHANNKTTNISYRAKK